MRPGFDHNGCTCATIDPFATELREIKTHQLKSPGMATVEACLDWLEAHGADMTRATIHQGPDGFFRGSAMGIS